MKTFTDANGREWCLSINVDSIEQVKTLIGFDLLAADSGGALEKLVDDPRLLCKVLHSLVKEQADAAGVTDRDFARAFSGDTVDGATDALLNEWIQFFPTRKREVMTLALAKIREIEGKAIELMTKKIAAISVEQVEAAFSAIAPAPFADAQAAH